MVQKPTLRFAHAVLCFLGLAVVTSAIVLPADASQRPAANRFFLYVADPGLNAVAILDSRYRLVRSISQGVYHPTYVWFDKHNNLYVVNPGGSGCFGRNVVEYPPGATVPRFTYSAGLTCPTTVTTDSLGYVYVYDDAYFINVYRQGENEVVRHLKMPTRAPQYCHNSWGGGLVADDKGNVFVAINVSCNHVASHWQYTALFEFAGGKGSAHHLNDGPGNYSPGLILDRSGNLIVTSTGGGNVICDGSVVVFAPPYTGSYSVFASGNGNGPLCYPGIVTLSPDQSTLFVTNSSDSGTTNILVYSYPAGQFLTTIGVANGLLEPYGLAVSQRS